MALSGLPKVFEIARNFRNEGVSSDHHPEFTSMEAYTAFMDTDKALDLCLSVLNVISDNVQSDITFKPVETARRKYGDLLNEYLPGFDFDALAELEPQGRESYMRHYLKKHNLLQEELREKNYLGTLDWLFKKGVRPHLIEPIVVSGYLIEQMPLAASTPKDERFVEGFQVIVDGAEIVKAYSEEVDPIKLRRKLESQLPASGEDITRVDTRLIDACEMGLPPMFGIGWGLDRIHKILSRQLAITDVIPVPLTRG